MISELEQSPPPPPRLQWWPLHRPAHRALTPSKRVLVDCGRKKYGGRQVIVWYLERDQLLTASAMAVENNQARGNLKKIASSKHYFDHTIWLTWKVSPTSGPWICTVVCSGKDQAWDLGGKSDFERIFFVFCDKDLKTFAKRCSTTKYRIENFSKS